MAKDKVNELHVIGEGQTIFSNARYGIPLYQRGYAWEEKEIVQLIEDIDDVSLDEKYYIGSLIVAEHNGVYEVIDGQQRLTTIYLLLCCLDYEIGADSSLTFECRDRSNYTLRHIREIYADERDKFDSDRLQDSIISGLRIIRDKLSVRDNDEIKVFLDKLSNVVLYRIEVPEYTDLNHYFEIMNTRGEQLEQTDVLKAKLMSYLDKNDQRMFATIWDACRDMTGYVQMHFTTDQRISIFGWDWGGLPSRRISDYKSLPISKNTGKHERIADIIKPNYKCIQEEEINEEGSRVRFESILDFPYFLIHTLRVYLDSHPNIIHPETQKLMDDKKLTSVFEGVLNEGEIDGVAIDKKRFSKEFVICLLRTRFLYDKYIIKREYIDESSDGDWSLKSLHVSGQGSNKRPYYKNTHFAAIGQWETTSNRYQKENLMLQSAMRVSYTSPKVMHWITLLLIWLTNNVDVLDEVIPNYLDEINRVALIPVKEFLEEEDFMQGVNTHHMVLNYLDYLLWKQNKNVDFTFEFRNSVEHWYPQNPSEGTFEKWEDNVDSFGNLCLVQRNVNSRFSNMSPEAKMSTFKEMIQKGSLKLRKMAELTDGQNTSQRWKETIYKEHENDMIEMLREAVSMQENV